MFRNIQAALERLFSGKVSVVVAGIRNNIALQWLNAAGTANVDVLKLNGADTVEMAVADNHRLILNSVAKTIVDGAATSLFDVACGAAAMVAGVIFYQVEASDGTDHQAMSGMVTYAAVNKAGTHTLAITEVAGNQAKAVSAGTLTLAWTFVTGTNKGTVKLQPTGSLTETVYRVTYTVMPIKGAVTIL